MRDVDVVIVGAGPAGCATAINLAPFQRVLVIERRVEVAPRVGESLVPAARRLFADMGLLESFLQEQHEPWYGNRSVWGNSEPEERDFLRDPDGHGWHLDRPRFESWLRALAQERGAELLSPATLDCLQRSDEKWFVRLKTDEIPIEVTARFVIDAGGHSAPVIRKLGPHQVCFYFEPHPAWEKEHQLCRSVNLLSDGSAYASLEDHRSLLYRLNNS